MITLKSILILAIISIIPLHGRLVFKSDSDVGYILPDSLPDEAYRYDNAKKFLRENEVKNQVKRAFWDTFLDRSDVKSYQKGEKEERFGVKGYRRSSKQKIPDNLKDAKHGVVMGVSDDSCDNAKTNLEMDWDGSPSNYTCFTPKIRLAVQSDLPAVETCDDVPDAYYPQHFCMNHKIDYNTTIPTAGDHRPLWAIFGEYTFLPPQRWLHNIEHGSVVMLYHPCAEPLQVKQLKMLIKKCVYKHVITASNLVPVDRPLVLVAWGCKLEMSEVDEEKVVSFIRARALHGPEGTYSKQGTYNEMLIHQSKPPNGSDIQDSNICSTY